jgi:DnaJ like chaperone protein
MWWGKIVGAAFGYLIGGPLGAVLGAALGHSFDKGFKALPQGFASVDREQVQKAFFNATFSVMGHLAKADGHVSAQEIRLAEQVMAQMMLDADMRQQAIDLFTQGKDDTFPVQQVVEDLRQLSHGNTNLLYMFLEIQVQAAYVDGYADEHEGRLLRQISDWLGISRFDYQRIVRMVQAEAGFSRSGQQQNAQAKPSLDDAYAILGVSADASDADVKKAYRRLLNQHHPDKLASKGLPEEMMKVAAQKTHEIKQAYEYIKQARK